MVTCRIPVICYTGCGCTVLDESRDPKQHQWPGHVCTKACPAYDIRFVAGLCEGARSKILFNDDLGSECNNAATPSPLEYEEKAPGYDEQAPKDYAHNYQRGCLSV